MEILRAGRSMVRSLRACLASFISSGGNCPCSKKYFAGKLPGLFAQAAPVEGRSASFKKYWIVIEGWDYLVEEQPNRGIFVWHHVTPRDGGYGQEVNLILPYEYFQTHNVEEFWEEIASKNTHPSPEFFNKPKELRKVREMLEYFGVGQAQGDGET